MKQFHSILTIATSFLSVSSFAGSPDSKQTVPPPPPPACGSGSYSWIDGGDEVENIDTLFNTAAFTTNHLAGTGLKFHF